MKKIPEKGLSKEQINQQLQEKRKDDFDWRKGRAFASIYDAGVAAQSVIYDAYKSFLTENVLDPTLFPSLKNMENEVISMCASLLHGDENTVGNLTTGGTESCMLAVKTAKFYAKKKNPNIKAELIIPHTIHFAFLKACEFFEVKPVVIPTKDNFEADVKAMEAAINENTIMIVGSAPNFAYGVMDPIHELGGIALKHNILFHVDGCIGAFVLSYYKKNGIELPDFGFNVPGVTSISMDLHKFGYAAKGCSSLLFKNNEIRKNQYFMSSGWTSYNVVNTTIVSTKPGGPIAGAWAAFHYFGENGYCDIARKTKEATDKIVAGIQSVKGCKMIGNTNTPLIAFTHEKYDVFQINDILKSKGWYLTPQLSNLYVPSNLHLTITVAQHGHEDEFITDLKAAIEQVAKGYKIRKLKDDATIAVLKKVIQNTKPETLQKVADKLGLNGGGTPKNLALISRLLDELPKDKTDPIFLDLISDLYHYKE